MNHRLRTTLPLILMITLLASAFAVSESSTSAQTNPPPPDLFASAAPPPGYVPPDEPSIIRSRFVVVDNGQLTPQTPLLTLNLFPGTSYLAIFQQSTVPDPLNPNRFVWQGTIDGIPTGQAILAVNGGSLAVTVSVPNELYHIVDSGQGPHFVKQTILDDPMPETAPIPVLFPPGQPEPGMDKPAVDDGSIIDVMVLYTPAARVRYGQAGIEAKIDLAVAETNTAYTNSQIATQLRLAYKGEVNYAEVNLNTDLDHLRQPADGTMDEIHALRNTYQADAVSLILENAQSCGLAYQMTSLTASFESVAFSVVASNCATGYYSFGHELGAQYGRPA